MAKKTTETEDQPRKKKGAGSILVWTLLVLVMLGLGGFGVTNFGGGVSTIGKVGEREITTTDYARALQQEMNALSAQFGQPITFAQAQAFGLDQRVLQTLITQAALDNEAAKVGISVGDATVANEITAMRAFQGTAGSFDRDTYRFTLERNNLTEAEFEAASARMWRGRSCRGRSWGALPRRRRPRMRWPPGPERCAAFPCCN
jgi:peptidyl-prolyl cis-trans isomerase D